MGASKENTLTQANWKKIIIWGGGIGLIAGFFALVPKVISGQPLISVALGFATANSLIISPLYEEYLCRGALLGSLREIMPFWIANIFASLFFLLLHVPGWLFMGQLASKFAHPLGGALSILILGLIFGYATKRSNSFAGGTLAHFINNLANL